MSIILIGVIVLIVWGLLVWCVRHDPSPRRGWPRDDRIEREYLGQHDPDEVERRLGR